MRRGLTNAERQRRHRARLRKAAGRRVYFDLPPEAVRNLDALRARYGITQAELVTRALAILADHEEPLAPREEEE